MAKRGRKSAESKSIKPVLAMVRKLPEAPPELTPGAAAIWRDVVAGPAGHWIDRDNFALLGEYCEEMHMALTLRSELRKFKVTWTRTDEGLAHLSRLTQVHDKVLSRVGTLASKLKICPSSRLHREKAGTIVADHPRTDRVKPWDWEPQ